MSDDVNKNFDHDLKMQQLKDELIKKFADYRTTMAFMSGDAPIGVLCLPPAIENILLDNGLLRIYDLFNVDFVKIKGLGESRIRNLTARLDQFFSML